MIGDLSAGQIGIPFVVVIEQLRGRFDAYLKAEPENLLREQERLLPGATVPFDLSNRLRDRTGRRRTCGVA